MFKWYTYCLKNFFTFKGRASRGQYWSFTLINIIIPVIVFIFLMTVDQVERSEDLALHDPVAASGMMDLAIVILSIFAVYCVVVLIPSIAVTVRRLHDRNHSGWWVFWSWILPFLVIPIFFFLVLGSREEPNSYGLRAPKHPKDVVPDLKDLKPDAWEDSDEDEYENVFKNEVDDEDERQQVQSAQPEKPPVPRRMTDVPGV